MDREKEYRRCAMIESEYTSHNALVIKSQNFNQHEKQLVWLRALGLIETWDMV